MEKKRKLTGAGVNKVKQHMKKNTVKSYSGRDHTFAVCAYGESPYLDECVRSPS